MRISRLLLSTCLAVGCATGSFFDILHAVERRQNDNSALPSLGGSAGLQSGTTSGTASASGTAASTASGSSQPPTSVSATISGTQSASPKASNATEAATTSTSVSTISSTPTPSSSSTAVPQGLPLTPQITPAFAIGGVVLLISGIAYGLIGVKNRWVHISLSTAYLTSLSICVLIVYVMNPPVGNAIQGAYFVGFFMTGVIFGAGALVFKEVTEGLGCLLGGFCLAMWFLTLKDGGLITNTTGKAIFISVFCVLAWATSFSHYTRPYGLIGSTSFAGSTAFVLGIDCFSLGGLKEFWVWIWNLNPNLFPLSATTYPITRATRVETIVIVLGCIICIISQSKLWKVVRDRQLKRAAELQDRSRRQDVVEAALGRHLERRNDRDKSEWERQYGNLLNAKRDTILWTDAHREKNAYSRLSESEVDLGSQSPSTENLELSAMPQRPTSVYVARLKRQSSAAVDTIAEVDESENAEPSSRPELSRSQSDDVLGQTYKSMKHPLPGARLKSSRENLQASSQGDSRSPEIGSESPKLGVDNSMPPVEPKEYRSLKVGSRASFRSPEPEEYLTPRGGSSMSLVAPVNRETQRHSSASNRLTPVSLQEEFHDAKSGEDCSAQRMSNGKDLEGQYLTAVAKDDKKRRSWTSIFSKSSANGYTNENTNPSQEALVVPNASHHHSRASSLAATLDSENDRFDLNIDTSMSHANPPPNIVVSTVRAPDSAIEMGKRKAPDDAPPPPPALEEEFDADPEELVRPTTRAQPDGQDSKRQSSSAPDSSKRRSGLDSEVGTEILFEDGGRSHAETTNTSMSEILTKGALEKLPSQLSNIVLSYRTNEWAKHASSAEAPVYEEPEPIEEETAEVPAHLLSKEEVEKQAEIIAPPPLSRPMTAMSLHSPTEAAVSNPLNGIKANPAAQSNPALTRTTSTQSVQPQMPVSRTTSQSNQNKNGNVTRGLRSTSTPMLVPNLATATIDENAAVEFIPNRYSRAQSTTSLNRLSADSSMQMQSPGGYHHAGTQPYGNWPLQSSMPGGSTSRLSMNSGTPPMPTRSASQTSVHQPRGLINGRLETRMASYDSHQPQRRNTDLESQRREAMFADWRISQQKNYSPAEVSEAHHAQRIFEKLQAKQAEEQQKSLKAQQEMQINIAMRGRDMQEAHREALRRMQAGVNKKLTH